MDETRFEIDRKDLIEGLGKGLRIIESFDDDHPRLTPSEAGQRAGISRTAARRYLLSLCHFGYAATDGRLFWLMPRVLVLPAAQSASRCGCSLSMALQGRPMRSPRGGRGYWHR